MLRALPLAWLLALSSATMALADQVTVFAAASLKTALDPIAAQFEAKTGNKVQISYAGSNTLAQQIIAGAPADLFISANEEWMDEVAKAGLLVAGSRQDLLGNSLVLVAHEPAPEPVVLTKAFDLAGLLGTEKLAMAMVDAVPAGQYGKAALEYLGLWDAVAPKVAQSENVRAALALVALGEAPYGIVYATDAVAEPKVHILASFPPESYPPITYPVALLTTAQDAADRDFLAALSAADADAIFTAQGFTLRK